MSEDVRVVFSSFYTGETGRLLYKQGTEAQLVALYHLTCRESHVSGLYTLLDSTIAENTGIATERVTEIRRVLAEMRFAERDGRWVWVRNMLFAQTMGSANPQDSKVIAAGKAYIHARNVTPALAQAYSDYYREIIPGAVGTAAFPARCPVKDKGKAVPEYWYVDVGSSNTCAYRAYPSDWAPIATRMWDGETFQRLRMLGPEYLLLALYLIRPPNGHVTGIYRTNLLTILSHIRIEGRDSVPGEDPYANLSAKLDKLRLMLARLCEAGFAEFDEDAGVMFVVNALSFHITRTGNGVVNMQDNKVRGVLTHLKEIGRTRLFARIRERYEVLFTGEQDPAQKELFKGMGVGAHTPSKAPHTPPYQAPPPYPKQAPVGTPSLALVGHPAQAPTEGARQGPGSQNPEENLLENSGRTLSPLTPLGQGSAESQAGSERGREKTDGAEKRTNVVSLPGVIEIEGGGKVPEDGIPYVEIVRLWNRVANRGTPTGRKLRTQTMLTRRQMQLIKNCWLGKANYGNLAAFELVFVTAAHNKFLNGDSQKSNAWSGTGVDFGWVITLDNFNDIVHEKYSGTQENFNESLLEFRQASG